jgi:hypothetical protein
MAIPGWVFNQVSYPEVALQHGCTGVIYQSGYYGDPTFFVGRDEIASAIATAERQIAEALGFFPAPKYICNEQVEWIYPRRGWFPIYPTLRTRWGHIKEFGVETRTLIASGPWEAAVVYTDSNGDGVKDWATITVSSIYGTAVTEACEIEVVFADMDPSQGLWTIRPLNVSIASDGTITITGHRWLFVDPTIWATNSPAVLSNDAHFVTYVDVYRRYTDTTQPGVLVSPDVCLTGYPCADAETNGCAKIVDSRVGHFMMEPATWTPASGQFVRDSWTLCNGPTHVKVSYLAGHDDAACIGCTQMGEAMMQAIVRLANNHMVDIPCGCNIAGQRFERDREEVEVRTKFAARALRLFGESTKGTVFAASVVDSTYSLGKGG